MVPEARPNDIAIVGMSLVCPGASTVGKFWSNLAEGVDSITEAPAHVIEPFYLDGDDSSPIDRFPSNRGGFITPGVVDPMRYGFLPVAAEGADPDQLLSYMLAEDALNDAGVMRKQISLDRAAVIVGRGNYAGLPQLRGAEIIRIAEELTALLRHAAPGLSEAELLRIKRAYQASFGRFQGDTATATMPNLVASGVANHFDMHGPAYCLDSASASGIVALQHASRLLQSGESDIAVVGAMHTAQSAIFWGAFTMLGALSRAGQIAPFSADADGLLLGQGAGYMVVKTVERALADEDRIYAVVKATAVGSNGAESTKSAALVDGQCDVIQRAWRQAGLDVSQVAYIEANGTGAPDDDASEIEALTKVFGDRSATTAYIGSVKSNIGHLLPAAGMVGLMKTALALYHRQIPPTLHCSTPVEAMASSRFQAVGELIDWQSSGLPLVAGVDAFGFGGANAHAVLTAYQEPAAQASRYRADRRRQLSPEAYAVAGPTRQAVLDKIDIDHFTSQFGSVSGRADDPCRLVIFNPTPQRQALAMDIVKRGQPWLGRNDIWYTEQPLLAQGGKVAFLFPGWDASAGVDYDTLVDELDLETHRYPGESDDPSVNVVVKHFKTSLLVHQGLRVTGVTADYYGGHSVGEWHAARAAGMLDERFDQVVLDLSQLPMDAFDGLIPDFRLVAASGDMSDETVAQILNEVADVYLTNDNCPSQKVFCAVGESVKPLLEALEARHVVSQVLPFGTAMHTPLFSYVLKVPMEAMSSLPVHQGVSPLISAVSLAQAPWGDQVHADSLGDQLTQPVYFRQLVDKLYDLGVRVFIQSGVGSLTSFIDDTLRGRPFGSIQAISPLRSAVDQLRRVHALLFVMGGQADLDFMGMRHIVQEFKTLFLMPNGSPIVTELPVLSQVMDKWSAQDETEPASMPSVSDESVVSVDRLAAVIEPEPLASPTAPVAPVSSTLVATPPPIPPLIPAPVLSAPVGLAYPLNQRGLPQRGFTRAWSALPGGRTLPPAPGPAPLPELSPHGRPDLPQDARLAPPDLSSHPAESGPPSFQSAPPAAVVANTASSTTPSLAPVTKRAGTSFEVPLDISLDDHPYVLDHSIVNQPEGWPHREDFYSVVPLTMSLELMAEIAMAQAPGLVVAKLGPVTAMDFISVTMPFHSKVQGFWKSEYTVSLTVPGRLMIDITLAERHPDSPSPEIAEQARRDIGPKIREPIPVEEQYIEYSFHRPRYWSALEFTHYGEKGFVTIVRQKEGKGSLLDQMGQSIGLFLHLYMPDNRVSFPVRVKEVTFYQDMFDQSGVFESYCVIRQLSDRFITGDVFYLRDGQVWAIARGWVNQRLGMEVELWESVNHPWRSVLARQVAPGVYYYDSGDPSRSAGYFLVLCYLSAQEKGRIDALPTREAQTDFIAGRIALKDGVRSWLRQPGNHYRYPIEVSVSYDENGKPVVRQDDGAEFPGSPQISVAHSHGRGVAMVSSQPVGVDIERIGSKDASLWQLALTEAERDLIEAQSDPVQWAIRAWVAKEAYAKNLGTGLGGAPKAIVIDQIEGESLAIGQVWIDTMQLDDFIIGWTRVV